MSLALRQLNPIHKKGPQSFFFVVASFYEDDSISRVLPGKKDMISTERDDGTKEKKRKRL